MQNADAAGVEMKIKKVQEDVGRLREVEPGRWEHDPKIIDVYKWFCPGCGFNHSFWMDGRWTFDGNEASPTFSPSLLLRVEDGWRFTCHTFVQGGMIKYLDDCSHSLAGRTVEMVDLESKDENP